MTKTRKAMLLGAAAAIAGGLWTTVSGEVEPPTINRATVTSGPIAATVTATGTLQAVTTVQVGTQVSGVIQELTADFNSLVRKGDVIARLDPSTIQTEIEQARASLTRAEADRERLAAVRDDARAKHERALALAERGLLPPVELEGAALALRSADAQVRSADAAITQAAAALNQQHVNLQRTVIRAPIDGFVVSRSVDRGQTVAASMSAPTLFVIAADLTAMQVIASVDESDVGSIRPNQTVSFRVDAYPNRTFKGTVAQVRLQPVVAQNVTTYATVIDVPNPNLELKPGMTANVTIEIAARPEAVQVPNAALRFAPTEATYAALGLSPPATTPRGARPRAAMPLNDGESRPIAPALQVTRASAADTGSTLFGPVESPDMAAQVWVFDGEALQPIPVRVGISDGRVSELLSGDLEAGAELITSITPAGQTARAAATPQNIFSGQRSRP